MVDKRRTCKAGKRPGLQLYMKKNEILQSKPGWGKYKDRKDYLLHTPPVFERVNRELTEAERLSLLEGYKQLLEEGVITPEQYKEDLERFSGKEQ